MEVAGRTGRLRCVEDCSPEWSWAAVNSDVVTPVVQLHEKIAEMHQEVQGSGVMRKRGSGGSEGGNAHRSWPETATEVAARRPPMLAAWWRGEEGGVGKNGDEGVGFL